MQRCPTLDVLLYCKVLQIILRKFVVNFVIGLDFMPIFRVKTVNSDIKIK